MNDFPGAPDDSGSLGGGRLRVLAAMSGGVDSAVAAARVAAAGHEVTGVHLALSSNPQSFRTGARGCCTLEDSRDARRAADVIGIPFYVWDLAERFREDVIDDFVAEYAAGRTPNPCLRCNEKIKFSALLDKAVALGFDAVCTGHYAQILTGPDGARELHRAVDPAKDQSYVLGVLDADQLAHALFPLGDTPKELVREEAERRGLAVAKKPDSHDICFIADGDTQGFLEQRLGAAPGEIVDVDGTRLGEHSGAYGFTIGQRKGLRIGHPAADGKPRYVLDISPVDNRVTVGPVEALDVAALTGIKPRWCGEAAFTPGAYTVQLRAHGEPVPASAELVDGELRVVLDQPARGIAPGQAVVLYQGTRVVGSATIATTSRGVLSG
ncbi:tRNA-specific 2-thiouridylase [Streptacidiphilus sp. MAP12-16]|uniref:tRNA 2-thiouridine(34) synthase MnmA n=1 Tax=Streptacidiphilus sp. MAP12-16 TaxID=3156300 RepID=UPI00351400DE